MSAFAASAKMLNSESCRRFDLWTVPAHKAKYLAKNYQFKDNLLSMQLEVATGFVVSVLIIISRTPRIV